jgi:hypothetical protein
MPSRIYALLRKLLKRGASQPRPLEQEQAIAPANTNQEIESYARSIGMDEFPNDLTRMLYLASLRDCNSGIYLHPQLSQSIGVGEADQVLHAYHHQVFGRLLSIPLSSFVLQMEEYVRYTRTDRNAMLRTWQSLQAYRSTIPVAASPLSAELFCLNIELSLTILREAPAFLDYTDSGS